MFRMLGCLALAMSAGAALLSWMEPPTALTDPTRAHDRAARVTRLEEGVALADWRSVEITPFAHPSGLTGLAALPANRHHFQVTVDGIVRRGPSWQRQEAAVGHGASVLIALEARDEGEPMPIAEWIGLRALLMALSDQMSGEGVALSFQVGIPRGRAGIWSETLRDWLVYDGFLDDRG